MSLYWLGLVVHISVSARGGVGIVVSTLRGGVGIVVPTVRGGVGIVVPTLRGGIGIVMPTVRAITCTGAFGGYLELIWGEYEPLEPFHVFVCVGPYGVNLGV